MVEREPTTAAGKWRGAFSGRVLTWWFGLMSLSGLLFGYFAERRPFGDDILAYPLVVFFVLVGLALLVLRLAAGRPVPDVISDRMLIVGCVVGLGAFLIGNWFAIHLAQIR